MQSSLGSDSHWLADTNCPKTNVILTQMGVECVPVCETRSRWHVVNPCKHKTNRKAIQVGYALKEQSEPAQSELARSEPALLLRFFEIENLRLEVQVN